MILLSSKYFYYDESSNSKLRWKIPKGRAAINAIAGTKSNNYYRVKLDGRIYQVHRIVWALFNGNPEPSLVINHIDCNSLNNSLDNLEVCTRKENSNKSKVHTQSMLRSNNTSGINGIHECIVKYNTYAKVSWYSDKGSSLCKLFSYNKLGKEKAWEEAILFKNNLVI